MQLDGCTSDERDLFIRDRCREGSPGCRTAVRFCKRPLSARTICFTHLASLPAIATANSMLYRAPLCCTALGLRFHLDSCLAIREVELAVINISTRLLAVCEGEFLSGGLVL